MSLITRFAALVLSLVAVRLVFPYGFPLILPLIACLVLLCVVQVLASGRTVAYDLELVFVYLALVAFILIGTGFSPTLYANVRTDLVNAVAGLLMIPVLSLIATDNRLAQLLNTLAVLIFLLMLPVAALCIYKFFMLLNGVRIAWLVNVSPDDRYPVGSALQADYNMAALGLSIGAAGGIWLAARTQSPLLRWLTSLGVALVLAAALLAGSRRFYLLFVLAVSFALIYAFIRLGRSTLWLLARWRMRRAVMSHALIATGVAALLIVTVGPRIGSWLQEGYSYQVDRLIVRASTLLRLLETFESGRGTYLAETLTIIDRFSISEYFLGTGFDYLEQLGEGGTEDYPHNPLMAALLHGGILNLVLVVYVLVRAATIYLGQIAREPFLASAFFITLVFTSISGNTIFSNRFSIMLLILAFLLRSTSTEQVSEALRHDPQ